MSVALTEFIPLWWLLAVGVIVIALARTLVDRPPRRRTLSASFRAIAVLLTVLALCRPTAPITVDRLHVRFLIDLSASVDMASAADALDEIEAAINRLEPADTWSLESFASGQRHYDSLEQLREEITPLQEGTANEAFRASTNLSSALESSRTTLPGGVHRRVVIFTDRRPTEDPNGARAAEAIERLRDEGADIQIADVQGRTEQEVAVTEVNTSTASAFEGETVRITATLRSNTSTTAQASLVHRGVIVQRQEVSLAANQDHEVEFSVPMVTSGRSVWSVEVVAPEDHFLINNRMSSIVNVSGRPRILVIHEHPREMRYFQRALTEQDIVVVARPPTGLPERLEDLLAFDAVVLADAPATAFSHEQMNLLRRFVADFAGGLAMFGSQNSFGLGGYHRTPVEEALPLVSRYEKEEQEPSVAMALVIDKSGSMQGAPIAMARQAAISAVELLADQDQVAVIAFDGQAYIASPMQSAADKPSINIAINQIGAGGGTFLYAGLSIAEQLLDVTSAQKKHIIVLSDGVTQPADHLALVRRLADRAVTVSTIALGGGADKQLLASIAQAGSGRYYETMDPANVPQIFTRETMQASRSAIKEVFSSTVAVASHPMFTGVSRDRLPFTLGYVMTRPKPSARVLLATDAGDPLLAVNHYGLGSTLAFTSDVTNRWGAEWVNWPQFGRLWAQAIRSIVRRPEPVDRAILSEPEHNRWSLTINEPTTAQTAHRERHWRGEVTSAHNGSTPVHVTETGIGRWKAEAQLGEGESFTMRLHDDTTGELIVTHHQQPYPEEYSLAAPTTPALEELPTFEPTKVRQAVPPVTAMIELAPWSLVAATVMFIVGVVLRRT